MMMLMIMINLKIDNEIIKGYLLCVSLIVSSEIA